MYKKIITCGVIVIILGVVIFFAWKKNLPISNEKLPFTHTVVIGDKKFMVRAATTRATQERGLSHFKKIGADEGMIFIFEQPDTYAFWMKDMRLVIDVIWLRRIDAATYEIVGTENNVLPESYPKAFRSPVPVDAFLELSEYALESLPDRVGQKIIVKLNQD